MADYTKDRYDALAEYGMSANDCGRIQLKNVPYNWKTRFPKMKERYNLVGWDDTKLGLMTPFWALWEDLIWGTSPLPFLKSDGTPNVSGSRVRIDVPYRGSYAVTFAITRAFGRYDFHMSHPDDSMGSEIDIWVEEYVVDPTMKLVIDRLGPQENIIKCGMRTTTFLGEGTITAYNEVSQLTNVYFKAPNRGYFKPGELIVGMLGWDLGSNSSEGWLYSHFCDIPVMFVRGTPVNVLGPITAMNCNVAGICIVGGAQNSYNFAAGLEFDDCPTGILSVPGFTRQAGGRMNINFIKVETGVTPESRGPWKGTIVAELDGQFCVNIGMINYAGEQCHTDSLFVLNPRLTNGDPQWSYLSAKIMGYGYKNIIQDNRNMFVAASPGDHAGYAVEWDDTGKITSNRTLVKTPIVSSNRLGFQRWNGSAFAPALDHTTGTPKYSYDKAQGSSAPPQPVACTGWTTGAWSAWGPCVGGIETRTRTVTATPAGCTGTPPNKPTEVETRACTVPVPPPGNSYGPYVMNSPTFNVPLNPAVTTKTVKITNLKASSLGFGRVLGSGTNSPSLAVDASGKFLWGAGSNWVTLAFTKVVAGVNWSGTLTLPVTAQVSCLFQTAVGQGGALQGTVEKIELA